MASNFPLYIIELYSPGEIVLARKPFNAETAAGALLAAKVWIGDRRHDATNLRVVDLDGTIIIDELMTKFN
jgi:hypothetical protein